MPAYETILYDVDGPVATITLNRPDALNTIVPPMPDEVQAAVREAVLVSAVRVIVLRGAGGRSARATTSAAAFTIQTLGPILDGLMRNTPDAHRFIELAERDGVAAAVRQRDAPFGDYSQGDKPDPRNVIDP